jgi:hypothetical protein
MKPLSTLIEIKDEQNPIFPIVEIFKKAFPSTKIARKNDLHIFYKGHAERPKVTVIYAENKLIIYKNLHIIGIGCDFDEKGAKNKLKEFL